MTQPEVKILPDPNKIHLISVKILKGNINCEDEFDYNQIQKFNTTFDIKQGYNFDLRRIRILFTTIFRAVNGSDLEIDLSAEYTIEFIFEIDNLSDFILSQDKEGQILVIDKALGVMLISIVYSTARGIILSRTQGTSIPNGILMPVVDAASFIDETLGDSLIK